MLEGHLLNERYRIKKTIGGGGMANVYLARDIILNRDVAIKVLRLEFANDPEFIERFDREAQAATSLAHPNIVNIYDVGEENHILYMVMEYIDGSTLKEYIIQNGPLDVEEAIGIMKQLTEAISHAHANGLIHRDIKPQNILLDRFGNVKVTDFGIAIALSATALTQTNSILGSVHYLSPEQARGGMATKKSDIYSLGIVFYELLTGQLPFSGQSPISIALKHLQDETPSIREINPNIPQSVENIVLKATAKDPFHRFESVYEMEEALNRALDPAYMNEPKYEPPVEAGEETKAIPIITDDKLPLEADEGETIVHSKKEDKTEKPVKAKDKPKEKQKKKKPLYKRKWFIGLLTLLLLAIVTVTVFALNTPKDVTIPDVVGLEYEEAKEKLEELNLKVNKESIVSDEVEEGFVVKTDPAEGRTVKERSTVDVFVSEGKEKVEFDDYVGQNFKQVERILEDAGYTVKAYEKISDEPIGQIITQIQPEPKEKVVPSETTVIFEVSSGPERVTLSSLSGMTRSEVQNYADRNNLTVQFSEDYSNQVKEGLVISQSPSAGTEVVVGSTIQAVISLGPKEQPPKTHKVTFTVPFQPKEDEEGNLQTEQTVQIYVDDMNKNITEVFHEENISSNREYTLTLVIAEGQTAAYKVVRDGEVIFDQKIAYEDVD